MPDETRRVYAYDPNQGFQQIEEPVPVVSKEPPVDTVVEVPPETPPEETPLEETPPETPPEETPPETPPVSETPPETPPEETPLEETPPETPPEETPPEETPPPEVHVTDNFYIAAAERLKASGKLPEDFALEESLSDDEADSKIFEAYERTLEQDGNKELLTGFQEELQKRGWTEDTLTYASLLENGVQPSEISRTVDYKTLSSVDASKLSEDDKVDYVRRMYADKGWNEKEIKRVLDSAEVDGEIDDLVIETGTYFGERYKSKLEVEKRQAQEYQDRQQQIAQYKQGVLASIFNDKQIGGEEMTEEELDEFEEAIYTRSVPVKHEGNIYNVAPFDQFQAALGNNFELQLWAFKKYIFRDREMSKVEKKALKKAEEANRVKWAKGTKPADQAQQTQQTNKQPSTQASQTGGDSFLFEGGQFKKIPNK